MLLQVHVIVVDIYIYLSVYLLFIYLLDIFVLLRKVSDKGLNVQLKEFIRIPSGSNFQEEGQNQ